VPGVTVQYDDLNRLVATFERNGAAMDSRTSLVVRKAAFDVERYAKGYAAVDTGFMKNSIHTVININNWRIYRADVVAGAFYSSFKSRVRRTSRMAPQPFMQPAADRVAPGFTAAMASSRPLDPR
jgi:hypothetical protein